MGWLRPWRLFAHPVLCSCLLLGVIGQSLKPIKLLATSTDAKKPQQYRELLTQPKCDDPLSNRCGTALLRYSSCVDYVVTCRLFSRGVIFTRARVFLALLSLRKNGGLLVAYSCVNRGCILHGFHAGANAILYRGVD